MKLRELQPETVRFYRRTLELLTEGDVRFMIGGAYALARYTDIERYTKDLDLFVVSTDLDDAIDVLEDAGLETKFAHPHWLAKVLHEGETVDLIFASGNGVVYVDETWFNHAAKAEVLGVECWICPPEETIAMKCFVMERERFDGADVAHMFKSAGGRIDWERLVNLFGPHWRVLFAHLVLFGYIYPSRRDVIPRWVMQQLMERLEREEREPPPSEDVCRGTLLSRAQYLHDLDEDGFKDARRWPEGSLTGGEIEAWTRAIDEDAE